jgi:hypothetical protein
VFLFAALKQFFQGRLEVDLGAMTNEGTTARKGGGAGKTKRHPMAV